MRRRRSKKKIRRKPFYYGSSNKVAMNSKKILKIIESIFELSKKVKLVFVLVNKSVFYVHSSTEIRFCYKYIKVV